MQAVYYRNRDGEQPVDEFIDSLAPRHAAVVDNQIDRLNMLKPSDPPLPFPHSSQVSGQLRELRCHYGGSHYRVLYRRSGRLIVLLHVSAKRSAKIPKREIETARKRWADFKARMDANPRRPPRAAGHDAP